MVTVHREETIVVVGGGIIGLATALEIQDAIKASKSDIRVMNVARDLPIGDGAFAPTNGWCSPWAGAMHGCNVDSGNAEADNLTYLKMKGQLDRGETAALRYVKQRDYWMGRSKEAVPPLGQLKRVFEDLRVIPKAELPEAAEVGLEYQTIVIDPVVYLPFLARQFQAAGGRFLRASLSSLSSVTQLDALSTSSVLAIVNCSGLGASSLSDVRDDTLVPSRKQSCLVRAPWHTEGDYHSEDEDGWFWIMSRPGGLVNIGGLIQIGQTDITPRKGDTEIMLKHALEVDRTLLKPELRDDPNATWRDLELVQENVGIHFSRGKAGERCELDSGYKVDGRIPVIHNDGHPSGYNSCYGFGVPVCDILRRQDNFIRRSGGRVGLKLWVGGDAIGGKGTIIRPATLGHG